MAQHPFVRPSFFLSLPLALSPSPSISPCWLCFKSRRCSFIRPSVLLPINPAHSLSLSLSLSLALLVVFQILLQKDMTILGIKSESEKAVRRLRSTSRKSASSYGDAAPYFVSDNSDSFSECGSYGSANGRLGELLAGLGG